MKTQSAIVLSMLASRSVAWALERRTMDALVAVARGDVRVEDLEELRPRAEELEELRPQAVRASGPDTSGGVAVLPLRGLIVPRASLFSILFGGGSGLNAFRGALREAVNDDSISAIVLDVDSPGGSIDLLVETAAELRAARDVKPVVSVANTWAASAAYWLASQGDDLVVTPTGQVGSIGVLTAHEDWSKFEEDFGVKTTLISAGRYKTEGNRFEPLSETARAHMQSIVDGYHDLFVADVAAGRGTSEAAVRSGYGEGRMITAQQAVQLGMADAVDTLQATVERLVREPARGRRPGATELPGQPAAQLDPPAGEVDEEAAARTRKTLLAARFG